MGSLLVDVVVIGDTRNRAQGKEYAELLAGYPGVRQVHLVYDRSVGGAVNRGIRHCRTDYVVIAGGDCWFDRANFARLLEFNGHRGYRFAHADDRPMMDHGFLDTGIAYKQFLLENPMDEWPSYCEETKFAQPNYQATGLVRPVDVVFSHRHDPGLPHMSSRTLLKRKLWSYAYKFGLAGPLSDLRRGIARQINENS
jgi:glycosyltransferase involved in cell wall biosynthesis